VTAAPRGWWLVPAALAAAAPLRGASVQADPRGPGAPAPDRAAQAELFRSDDVLAVTLRTDLRALFRDRDTTSSPWRAATLTLAGPAGPVTVPLQVRTRGNYRLLHCDVPPLRLRFGEEQVRGTPLEGLDRPKLATHCRSGSEYEQYLLHEYAIYRIYRLFTPLSFSTRLLRVTYEDTAGAARPVTGYAFLTEDPARLAARVGATPLDMGDVRLGSLERGHTAMLSVFQYFVANTDWAVPFQHNVALLRVADSILAVPFDFDWSGAINARYAVPARLLHIRSVRVRKYRGLCQPAASLQPVLARFVALRDSIAAVYRAVPGLDPRLVERTLRYYDEFYQAIEDPQRFVQRVVEPDCGW